MLKSVRGTVCALGLAALAASPALSSGLSADEQRRVQDFAANNSLFVLYHEIGHLLIDQLELPVLGRQEDAADNIATYLMLEQRGDEARKAIEDAADGWLLSSLTYEVDDSFFADAHALDQQRAYQIVCLMVGKDAETFGTVADHYAIDSDRRTSCVDDYVLLRNSLTSLLGRQWSKNGSGTDVSIEYRTAPPGLETVAKRFKQSGVFEQAAEALSKSYSIKARIRFVAESCYEPNAYYEPEKQQITYCYEMMDDYMAMKTDDILAAKSSYTTPAKPRATGKISNY